MVSQQSATLLASNQLWERDSIDCTRLPSKKVGKMQSAEFLWILFETAVDKWAIDSIVAKKKEFVFIIIIRLPPEMALSNPHRSIGVYGWFEKQLIISK